ncbi:unnamed protein product [Camellia sinensis]
MVVDEISLPSEDGNISLPPGSLIVLAHKEKEITNALEGEGAQLKKAEVAYEVALMSQTNMYRLGIDAKIYDMLHVMVSVKSRRVPGEYDDDVLTTEERMQLESALRMGNSDVLCEDEDRGVQDCHENGDSGSYESVELKEKKSWFGWNKKGSNGVVMTGGEVVGEMMMVVYPLAKTLTLLIACRIFLGMENPNRIARLVRYFDDVTLGLHSIMVNFPSTNFYRAGKATDAIRREQMAMVRERRDAMVGGGGAMKQDILSHMIVVSDPTGKGMGEAEIADKMMGLLVAGYANVAVTISFFMKFVGESTDIYNKVLSDRELLDWNGMSKMKYSQNVMCEVMRVVPPQQGTFKEILTDFTYAGYTIPKGWKVYWTVNTTNKNSKYFRDPEKFDPSRYKDGEAPAPYTYVPFGGGRRFCPRKEYAWLVVLTFIHNVVKKYKWEVLCFR